MIFATKEDDIINILSCEKFKTDVRIKNLKYRANIEINEDDKVTFIKTPEYLAKLNAALTAWNEIVKTPPRMINFDELTHWVDKYSVAYEMFENKDPLKFPMKWSPFLLIYPELQGFKEYLSENINIIRKANMVIHSIQTEDQLLEWLIKYENMSIYAPHGLKYSFRQKDDYFWWNYYNPIFF